MAKILIVDDDKNTASRMALELQKVGHECATRNDGSGVVDIARKSDLDLLILDVMLPGTSGFEVCRQIRSDEKLFTLPVVFVSSMKDEAEIQHGLAQGADGFITKPIELISFLQRIDRLLKMNVDVDHIDSITGTLDADGTRKMIQQHISRDEAFGLAYVELLNLMTFQERAGVSGREKALRHLARALDHYAELMGLENCMYGHMGGGHFIALVPAEQTAHYCENLLKSWHKHMKSFYDNESIPINYSDAQERNELLDLSICVTHRDANDHATAQQLLETLSRMHKIETANGVAGVHLDRRS